MCLPFPGYCSHLEGEALYPEHCTLRPHPGGAVQCSKGPLAAWGGAHWAGVENPLRGPTAVLGGTDFCFFSAFCMCYHCINQSPLRNRAFRSASLPLENLQSNTHRLIGLGLCRAIREQVWFVPPIRQAHQQRISWNCLKIALYWAICSFFDSQRELTQPSNNFDQAPSKETNTLLALLVILSYSNVGEWVYLWVNSMNMTLCWLVIHCNAERFGR